jgi:TPR repeat protein
MTATRRKPREQSRTRTHAPEARSSQRALGLPLAFICGLAAFIWLPQIRQNPALRLSFAGAGGVLLVWLAVLGSTARAAGRPLLVEVSLRPQHYLQAIAHASIFVFWGIYWPPIREAAPLIAAQIVFAYAFDMLLAWSRRDTYTLGFGPFPIIFSTNLFLRFHDDWFYLQFVMVAVGFLAKELIRWTKDGRRTHIFNPSSFTLALFSLVLIATGTTRITWGEEIATLLILPPHIYLFIFLAALPGQYLFRVTTMTLPAVLTTYLFSVVYFKLTGTYFFFDSNVPIAVFLGMHLLFTDPSTAPRTELGRITFGVLYGLSVVGLYALLAAIGAPTFYDKLLQVPLMNLMVKAIDRAAVSRPFAWLNPERLGAGLAPRRRSLAYVSIWIVVFGVMTAADGVGDYHPGHTVPFWEQACRDGRRDACRNLATLERRHCDGGSGWACNELGVLGASGRASTEPPDRLFQRACRLGFTAGCQNVGTLAAGTTSLRRDEPTLRDYPIVLREGKGVAADSTPFEIFTRACRQGWPAGCGNLASFYLRGGPVPQDKMRAATLLEQACAGGHGRSCSNLGFMYNVGDGVPKDTAKALAYLKKACDAGFSSACRWLSERT